jgi:hypothetical protein
MRGNTVAFNTAFGMAQGHILAETTAECMLPKDGLRQLLEPHSKYDRCFVALKTYNLTREAQRAIDTVSWQNDIMAISALPGWNDPWVQNNVANMNFGTHQVCSIRKQVFDVVTKGKGFPLFCDYGCLDGSTRVLTHDLRWVRNDSLKVGDCLVGVTEGQTRKAKRKFERSYVESIGEVCLPSIRIITDDGRDIIASVEHPWLVTSRTGAAWTRTDKLQVGDGIKRVSDVWNMPDSFESGWVAGVLDGEGSGEKGSGLRINITQNPGAVLERVLELYRKWGIDYKAYPRHRTPKKSTDWNSREGRAWNVRTRNQSAAMMVLGMAPSVRLIHKWEGQGLPIGEGGMVSRVIRLESVGARNLIGMTTSTHTFIAEGLVTHNSEDPWYANRRERNSVMGITLPNSCMAIHQWHAPFQYWMAKGRGFRLNKFAHSMSNYLNDKSGEVPEGGTCMIWDGGSHEQLSDSEKEQWKALDADVLESGVSPEIVRL